MSGAREPPDQPSRREVEKKLVHFFSNRFHVADEIISASPNLVADFNLSEEQWLASLNVLSTLPWIEQLNIPLRPTEMLPLISILKLTDFLCERQSSVPDRRFRPQEGRKFSAQVKKETFSKDRDTEFKSTEIVVWYGTNRCLIDSNDPKKGFSSERDTKIHYGICKVFIPESHRIGSVGSFWLRRIFLGIDDRLRLLEINAQLETAYWNDLKRYLKTLPPNQRHALIFVHGYNVTFENAAIRAAQIGCDLSLDGVMAFFSWPSRGTIEGYPADEATIEASEPYLTEFLDKFVEESGASTVHIIAHSMGNRGVLRAISNIAKQRKQSSRAFGQIVLAAADVDAETFKNLCGSYVSLALRTTLNVSARDRAVEASRWLHNFARVGLMPPVLVVPGINTISVTNADLTTLGHGYVGDARGVLQDIHDLVLWNAAPDRRFGLRPMITDIGEPFWVIGR